MHPMAFYQKRAHLGATARGMEMFAHVPHMTPARFDLLFLIYRSSRELERQLGPHSVERSCGYALSQATITETLGLSRQTIWKMVERLIELGVVTKSKDRHGLSRRNIVHLTDEGVLIVRAAINAAFSERKPLPRDAPARLHVPRYWRRPEMADPPDPSAPPARLGRDVERIYSSFVWNRIGRRGRTGRRGKGTQHLEKLDELIADAHAIAFTLGYRVSSIYTLRYTAELDH